MQVRHTADMGRERLEIEFGSYSEWLADAIAELRIDPIPASCRGTGNPALFERMAEAVGARSGMRVLDVGCGIGGPGAWLASTHDCVVIGVDVMEAGIRGLKRIFPASPAFVAGLEALPFRAATFDGAWALGVIETIPDKAGALAEVARVLVPGASMAIYSFVAPEPIVTELPLADYFEDPDAMVGCFAGTGLRVARAGPVGLPRVPTEWRASREKARTEVRRSHAQDPRIGRVDRERDKIERLVKARRIVAWEFVCRKETE